MQALKAFTATLCAAALLLLTTPATAQTVSTVAGTGTQSSTGDGAAATLATLDTPSCVLVRSDGSVLVAEQGGHRVRKIDAAGIITTFAGTGTAAYTASAGAATAANLNQPAGLAEDAAGNVYIGTLGAILKVNTSGALSTFAGDGMTLANFGDGLVASDVALHYPISMAFDASGNLFFADFFTSNIRRIDAATTIVTNIAGTGTSADSADGPSAATSTLNGPAGLVVQSDGSILVVDGSSRRVRKIIQGGAISTIAGVSGVNTSTGDNGPATAATIKVPRGLAKDSASNIYVGEFGANRIRKIAPDGTITTLLGTTAGAVDSTSTASNVDGPITTATIFQPYALAVDATGNLYAVSAGFNKVRKITPPVPLIPGPSIFKSFVNAQTATLGSISPDGEQSVPYGGVVKVTVAAKPSHVLSVSSNCTYVKTSQQVAGVPIGTGTDTFDVTVNGPCQMEATFTPLVPKVNVNSATAAIDLFKATERADKYTPPTAAALTRSIVGTPFTFKAWVTDIAGVPYPSATNVITFKANDIAIPGCVNVPLTLRPSNVIHIREANCTTLFSPAGNVMIKSEFAGDAYNLAATSGVLNHSVTVPSPLPRAAQTVSTFAGIPDTGGVFGDGGAATLARFSSPTGLLVRRDGSVLIADQQNNSVRQVDVAGIITTFAGTGRNDIRALTTSAAAATTANLIEPYALAEDALGNVYIGSELRIHKVSPSGALSTVTVTSDGSARNTFIAFPRAMAFDASGNLFFVDVGFNTIRKIDGTTNIMSHIAGIANFSANSPDGPSAATTPLNSPFGLVVQSDGSLLVAEAGGHRIRKIIPGGAISTIAGTAGVNTSTGDNGLATAATLNGPFGLAKDSAGNIYVAESYANRIRKITPNGIITTLLGTTAGAVDSQSPGRLGREVDGTIATANVYEPYVLAVDAAGNLYFAGSYSTTVRKITLVE
jgi:sugar lactone lactonase YvrE